VEWDETEQGWMLALRAYRASRCPGCNGDLAVTTAAENEDKFRAEMPVQCYRCVAFGRSQEAYREEPHPLSLLHLVPQRPVRTRPSRQ
jgi:hypothetical protein